MNGRWWDEETFSYAAGFLDGEGCFYAMPNKYCKPIIALDNSCKETVYWFKENFGGSVRKVKKQKSHHKQLYHWSIVANDAYQLCQAIAPYLKQKAEQALLIIAIQQTKQYGSKPLTDNIIETRRWFQTRLKELHNATI